MPSQYSSEGSVLDAIALADNLGIQYDTIPIGSVFNEYKSTLDPYFKNLPENVTEKISRLEFVVCF